MKIRTFDTIGETLYEETLSNGLRMFAVPKKGFRSNFAMIAVKYGGAYRSFTLGGEKYDTPAGVAHFLEHKLFDMPDGSDALTAFSENGASPNAYTSNDTTVYHFDCTDGFIENLKLLTEFVSAPHFTPQTVKKEQGIIAQEIGMYDDHPAFVIYNRLMRMLYSEHPIRDQVAGTVDSIAEISDKTLYDCYNTFYRPNNMVFCAAGDFDPSEVFKTVESVLGKLSAAEIPQPDFGAVKAELPSERYHEERMEISAPQFSAGAAFTAEKGAALQRQKLVSSLALRTLFGTSGNFYNRLYDEGLLNRDYDYEADYSADTATFILSGESPDPDSVAKEIIETVDYVRENGLDPKAFERAKRSSYGARLRGLEDFDGLCAALASSAFSGYCSLDAFELLDDIRIDECEKFLCEALTPERLALSVLLPVEVRA